MLIFFSRPNSSYNPINSLTTNINAVFGIVKSFFTLSHDTNKKSLQNLPKFYFLRKSSQMQSIIKLKQKQTIRLMPEEENIPEIDLESQTPEISDNSEEQNSETQNKIWRARAGTATKVGGMILGAAGAVAENIGVNRSVSSSLKGSGILLLIVSLGLENPFQSEEHKTIDNLSAKGLRTTSAILGIAAIAASNQPVGIAAITSQALASTIEVVPKAYNKAKECMSNQHEEEGPHTQALAEERRQNNMESGASRG